MPLAAGQSKRLDAVAAAIGHVRAELREIAGLLGDSGAAAGATPSPPRPPIRSRLGLAVSVVTVRRPA